MTTRVLLELEAEAFTAATATPPFIFNLGPEKGRTALDAAQAGPVPMLPVDSEDHTIPDGPRGPITIRILRPPDAPPTLPVIVYIHGAGWVFGNAHTHDRLVRELARGAGATVVFPNYSLSPEAKYPTALEECYVVTKWVAEHGAKHGMDPERLVVAGDNVGGNMTAALTLLAKERGEPALARQLLFYPVTDASCDTESYRQFAEGYYLRRDGMQWFWDQYTTNPGERKEITASPLRASAAQLRGLPPALVITAEADVLRDEGEAYARKLRGAGVRVTAARFGGTIHDFVMLNPLAETAAARGAMALAIAWLREGFALSSSLGR
ncbi:MAG TPA: alpha/beta hydrolase [Chloroflexia bacterium]|nr:alpha/beta hydrolase [Chloroflexia bacterium]